MIKAFIRQEVTTYWVLMVFIAISLPFSKFTLTLFQLLLLLHWMGNQISLKPLQRFFRKAFFPKAILLGLEYVFSQVLQTIKQRLSLFVNNKVALALASLFLLHLVGLLTTTDFDYALKDLRTKLPLLILPLIMSSMPPFTRKQTNVLLGFFVLAVFTGTLLSLAEYLKKEFSDIREISLYISSVRFSLMVAFSFFLLLSAVFSKSKLHFLYRAVFILAAIWLFEFLILIESVIGIVSVFVVSLLLLIRWAWQSNKPIVRYSVVAVLITMLGGTAFYLYSLVTDLRQTKPLQLSSLDKVSALGNTYRHDTIHFGVEDGKYVGIYLAENELAEAWNARSRYDFYGKDEAGQLIMYTIIRYLTSCDLRKDAGGVAALTAQDIQNIERGIANRNYLQKPGLAVRISKIITGYEQSVYMNDPSGSSTMQRIEHLKASWILIQKHFWLGVGTGDLPAAFKQTYDEMNSPLKPEVRWRSHNQYLSILIAFGIFGLIWFLWSLGFPIIRTKGYREMPFLVFWVIMLLSMLSEDTLETQIGLTLFAFFYSLFALTFPKASDHPPLEQLI